MHLHPTQLDPKLLTLRLQLARVKHAIAPPSLDDARLLLKTEVRPCERRVDDVPVQG